VFSASGVRAVPAGHAAGEGPGQQFVKGFPAGERADHQTGGPAVMAGQLTALAQATTRPAVTMQILPFSAGANAGLDGEFVILTFPGTQDPPIAYAEGLMGDIYLESEEELARYTLAWTHLTAQALTPAESDEMLTELAKEPR
jgi:hypothetical protein